MRKTTSFLVLLSFIFSCVMPPQGFAQTLTAVGLMPQPGISVALSSVFIPANLKGMVINPTDPFKFDFIIHRGDEALSDDQKQAEYLKLIKYFLASLAVPDTDQWVNLSPYEQDRIIPDGFGLTEMGRDLLAQDYLLKQISASLTNPDSDLGKKFWDGVYVKAYEKFGTTDIPTDTFNKVWITPDRAVVFEKGNSVVILEHHLKVMMESDYKAMKENAVDATVDQDNEAVKISKQVMREVIIPAIEKEVNEGKNFAPLRQVYSGMLLATWYKLALKESILGKLYTDKGKVKGIDQDPKVNQEIYTKYVEAFKKGVFNMIKEDVDQYSQEIIPRKYFSGGAGKLGFYEGPDLKLGTSDDGMRVERDAVAEEAARQVIGGQDGIEVVKAEVMPPSAGVDGLAAETRDNQKVLATEISKHLTLADKVEIRYLQHNYGDGTKGEKILEGVIKKYDATLRLIVIQYRLPNGLIGEQGLGMENIISVNQLERNNLLEVSNPVQDSNVVFLGHTHADSRIITELIHLIKNPQEAFSDSESWKSFLKKMEYFRGLQSTVLSHRQDIQDLARAQSEFKNVHGKDMEGVGVELTQTEINLLISVLRKKNDFKKYLSDAGVFDADKLVDDLFLYVVGPGIALAEDAKMELVPLETEDSKKGLGENLREREAIKRMFDMIPSLVPTITPEEQSTFRNYLLQMDKAYNLTDIEGIEVNSLFQDTVLRHLADEYLKLIRRFLAVQQERDAGIGQTIANYDKNVFVIIGGDHIASLKDRVPATKGVLTIVDRAMSIEELRSAIGQVFTPLDLQDSIQRSGFSNEQVDLMKNKGAGVLTVYDLLDKIKGIVQEGGFSLGLTNYMDLYQTISNACGVKDWMSAYREIWGDTTERTAEFMEHVTSSGKPVIFFVPSNLFTHGAAGVTQREFEWMSKNQDKLKNVYFVFGLYDTLTLKDYKKFPIYMNERIEAMTEAFRHHTEFLKAEDGNAVSPVAEMTISENVAPVSSSAEVELAPVVTSQANNILTEKVKAFGELEAAGEIQGVQVVLKKSIGDEHAERLRGYVHPIAIERLANGSIVVASSDELSERAAIYLPNGGYVPLLDETGKIIPNVVKTMTIDENDNIYVVTVDGIIRKYNAQGEYLGKAQVKSRKEGDRKALNIQGMVVHEGRVFYTIADTGEFITLDFNSGEVQSTEISENLGPFKMYGSMELVLNRSTNEVLIVNQGVGAVFGMPAMPTKVWKFDITTGKVTGPAEMQGLYGSGGLAAGADGRIFVADSDRKIIHVGHPDKGYIGFIPIARQATISVIQVDRDGNLLIGRSGGHDFLSAVAIDRLMVKVDGGQPMLGQEAVKALPYGGIDFAQSNLNMQIKRDGVGVALPISQQNLDNIRIDGLVPVILSIQPAANVSLLN